MEGDGLLLAAVADSPPPPPTLDGCQAPMMDHDGCLLATESEVQEQHSRTLNDFSEQLLEVLQDSLEKALQKELPLALEKELPRALGGSGVPAYASNGSDPLVKWQGDDEIDEMTETTTSKTDVSMTAQGTEKEDPDDHIGLNNFAARKYLDEFAANLPPEHEIRKSVVRRGHHPIFAEAASEVIEIATTSCDSSAFANGDIDGNAEGTTNSVAFCSHGSDAPATPAKKIRRGASVVGMKGVDLRSGKLKQHQREILVDTQAVQVTLMADGKRPGCIQVTALYITETQLFTLFTTLLIIVNALVIGAQTQVMAESLATTLPTEFKMVELCFCSCFIVELIIRIVAFQTDFLVQDWQWNLFDTLLVCSQVMELSLEFILGANSGVGPNMSFMRILRILRLVRVMRLVRVVRYISELRTIIASVFNSLRSLFFTILLIAFIIYVMSVALTQICTEYVQTSSDPAASAEISQYFGSLPQASLVLFQSMTNGIDWAQAAAPLSRHISPLMAVGYCIFIAFAQFAMLNVITGVFVERALEEDAEEKDAAMVGRLLDFLSGSEHPRYITWDEFQDRLGCPTMQLYFKSVDLDPHEARGLFLLLDADQSGVIEAEEFIMGCLRLRGSAKAIDLATLMYENRRWFRRFDNSLRKLEHAVAAREKRSAAKRAGSPKPPSVPTPPVHKRMSFRGVADFEDPPSFKDTEILPSCVEDPAWA